MPFNPNWGNLILSLQAVTNNKILKECSLTFYHITYSTLRQRTSCRCCLLLNKGAGWPERLFDSVFCRVEKNKVTLFNNCTFLMLPLF